MYPIFLAISLGLAYLFLLFLFAGFFRGPSPRLGRKTFYSFITIVVVSYSAYLISEIIPDPWLSNRVLHALGGGFSAFFVCFRVVQDSKLPINKFQFFVFSFLIVTAMGVTNELFEFFLQNYSRLLFDSKAFIFAPTVNDTWLDLISNLTGTIAGSIVFTPFIRRSKKL